MGYYCGDHAMQALKDYAKDADGKGVSVHLTSRLDPPNLNAICGGISGRTCGSRGIFQFSYSPAKKV